MCTKSRLKGHNNYLTFLILSLIPICGYSQKYEVLYAQFTEGIDTAMFLPSPFYPNQDTLAKWIFLYSDGKGLSKQTEDSPYEKKSYLVNKTTGNFDNIIRYNMGKNDIFFNDYVKDRIRRVVHFFDVKHILDDEMPYFEWNLTDNNRMILNYQCKHAYARYPLDKHLLFDVWYTDEIPINGGPMDINGLPGLVLEVERNGIPFYKALKVTRLSHLTNIIINKPEPNEKAITLSEYQVIRTGVPYENYNKRPPSKDSLKRK